MAVLLLLDLLAEILVEEAKEGVNVLSGCGGVLLVVSLGLVVPVLLELTTMMVENAIGRADGDGLAVEVDEGVVGHNGLEGVDEMLRVDDHDGLGDIGSRGLEGILILRVVIIVAIIDLIKGLGDGTVARSAGVTTTAARRSTGGSGSIDLGEDLENRLLRAHLVLVKLGIFLIELWDVLESRSALTICRRI